MHSVIAAFLALLAVGPAEAQPTALAGNCSGTPAHLPQRSVHTSVLVAVNRLGQVSAIRSRPSPADAVFDTMVERNATQAVIRPPRGPAIAGVYRVSYAYDAKTHAVRRVAALLTVRGVDANARPLPYPHCFPPRSTNVHVTLRSDRLRDTPLGPRIELERGDWPHPFSDMTTVTAVISPAPSTAPQVRWRISSPIAVLAWPRVYPPPTPPPSGTLLAARDIGRALLTVTVGAPVGQSVSIPVYSYATLNLGCDFRATPAYAFAPDGAVRTVEEADVYVTAPGTAGLSSCRDTPFATAPDTPSQLHVPYGGTMVTDELSFEQISAGRWENSTTVIPLPLPRGVLLFRTRTGRIVKMLGGRYEVSDPAGTFPF